MMESIKSSRKILVNYDHIWDIKPQAQHKAMFPGMVSYLGSQPSCTSFVVNFNKFRPIYLEIRLQNFENTQYLEHSCLYEREPF